MSTIVNIKPRTIEYRKRIRALDINGRTYVGAETAIKRFLKDNKLKISDIQWNVEPKGIIVADNIEMFKEAFYGLNIDWDNV